MDVVLVMFKNGERRDFPLKPGETVIGRRQDCHLRVPTADVSRQHCSLNVQGNAVTLQDLQSANGSYVNGARVSEATLNPGDRVKVGPAVFVLQVDGEPADISAEDTAEDLVALGEPDAPTSGQDAHDTPPSGSANNAEAGDDDDVFDISEEDLFEIDEDAGDDDPISAMEAILDDEDEDDDSPAKS